jgi:ankyrin repeat protein
VIKKMGMICCIAVMLTGCNTENMKKEQVNKLYKAIDANDKKQVESVLKKITLNELPIKDGIPPQLLAAQTGREDIAIDLLKNGASSQAATKEGITMLHAAAYNGELRLADYLLKNHTAIDVKTKDGRTPLMLAISPNSIFEDKEKVVEWFLKHNANPTAVTQTGWTALHEAVYQNEPGIVEKLIPFFLSLDIQDKEGTTPLMVAVQTNNTAIIQLLLQNGSTLEIQDKNGYTALSYAVSFGLDAAAQILLEHGADPNHRTLENETCFDLAQKSSNANVRTVLQINARK